MDSISDRIKAESIEMLEYFDAFCKKYNIEYCISFGTELGAVRHKGFIPWDDDVDVDMYYKELKKFEKAWKKYGDKKIYFLQNKKTDKNICTLFYRLRKNGTTWIDPNCENIPIHWGLPIDIFPVFNAPRSVKLQRIQYKFFCLADRFCRYNWFHLKANAMKKIIHYMLTQFFLKCVVFISNISSESNLVFYSDGYSGRTIGVYRDFFPSKPISFENIVLRGHNNPDKYLRWQYGNYMMPPPKDQRAGHPIGIIDLDNDYSVYTGKQIK